MVPADTHQAVDIRRVAAHILVADCHQAVDTRRVAAHILVADIRRVAVRILVVDYYRDLLAEVALGERTLHTDLADLGLDLD